MMELLSPAGNMEALLAAIRNGADAVYLGAQVLNARAGAGNFSPEELQKACDMCHERGKKVYVTVNTVVKEKELPLLEDVAGQLYKARADGAIIQDLGVGRALGQMLPGLELHASTQMALSGRQGARFLLQNGYTRMVIAREATLQDIRECAKEGIEVEAFGHGALCVACSGQCLFSSMVGGRSGNRGMCAQPCRLPYTLDGRSGYLLSPKDLMTITHLQDFQDAGVASLKLEGRLKRPEYVAVVTRIYREALDGAYQDKSIEELRQIFNRGGFTRGYAYGVDDSELMSHEKPNHMGVAVGQALGNGKARLEKDVLKQDQIVLGEDVVALEGKKGETVPFIGKGKGTLYRLASEKQLSDARQSYQTAEKPSVPVVGDFYFRRGEAALLSVSDGTNTGHAEGDVVQQAQKEARVESLLASLQKTGGTPYYFETIHHEIDTMGYLPASALNELRRNALEALSEARQVNRTEYGLIYPLQKPETPLQTHSKTLLSVSGGNWDMLLAARDAGADELLYEPKDHTHPACPENVPFALLLPAVCTADDLKVLHDFAQSHKEQITATVLSNPAQLAYAWPGTLRADYMLNTANLLTLSFLKEKGIETFCPSIELTAKEIEDLPGDRELVVYGRVPLMHLWHCPNNASLGGGKHDACRRCEMGKGTIEDTPLIDRKNTAFPLERLKTGRGCLVRVLNSVPLMLLRRGLPEAHYWRIMLHDENMPQAMEIISLHRRKLDGEDVRSLLPDTETTTGHYFRETP